MLWFGTFYHNIKNNGYMKYIVLVNLKCIWILGILVHCWVTIYNNDIVYSKISKVFEYIYYEEIINVCGNRHASPE